MAANKTIVLITGANGGIGFELVSLLMSDQSKYIILGSRSIEKGETAMKELLSRNPSGTVELIQLDVASEESISTAAKSIESRHGRLDAIVNNAATGQPDSSPADQFAQCFKTNATGPFLLVEAVAPLLKKSTGVPRIINVSSGAGSIVKTLDPNSLANSHGMWGIMYAASKAALNLLTAKQSAIYGQQGFKVFAYTPGFTVSGLGSHNTAENGAKPTTEGAAPMVKILNGERDGEHGGFLSGDGQYPW